MEAGAAPAIVTYGVEGGSGLQSNVPVTFGAGFARGDVPPGTSVVASDGAGNRLPLQVDIKTKHFDGSLRHAVVTTVMPKLAENRRAEISLSRGSAAPSAPLNLADLPANFDAVVELNSRKGKLRISARELLAKSKPDVWLSGALVTEWWISGSFKDQSGKTEPHLTALFGIRSYGKGKPLRVEVVVENTRIFVPKPYTAFYDATIKLGERLVFSKTDMKQPSHSRWRKVFWWGDAADSYVIQNLAYLKKMRVIPNYDMTLDNKDKPLDRLYARFLKNDRDPLGPGIIYPYMPATGGRSDIAPLPSWAALYLTTMDKRGYEMTLSAGDLAGGFTSHYRSEKTGHPATGEEYPDLTVHSNYVGRPGQLEAPDKGGYKNPLTPQTAHEPSLAFIPYLVTGEKYYLEELLFWSQWNAWSTAPAYRNGKDSLVHWDEVRGQAWSLRTLAQAAYITPENNPLKQVLLRQLKANIAEYDRRFTNNPAAHKLHTMHTKSDTKFIMSPWMDDYFTWSIGYIVNLGFDSARPFAKWKALYPVNRMIHPDYCWIAATPYRMVMQHPDKSMITEWRDAYRYTVQRFAKNGDASLTQCGSSEMAFALGLKEAGEMMGTARSGGGYPANLQPALAAAVDLDVPGAQEAWDKFQARPVKPKDGFNAEWAILPWGTR